MQRLGGMGAAAATWRILRQTRNVVTSPKAQRTSHQKLRAFQSHWPAAWQRLSMKQARTIPMRSDATPTIQLRAHHSRPSQRGAVTKDGASGGAPGNREQGTPSQHRRGASDRWKLRWERRSTVSGGRPPALRGGGYPHLPREVGAGTDVRERPPNFVTTSTVRLIELEQLYYFECD